MTQKPKLISAAEFVARFQRVTSGAPPKLASFREAMAWLASRQQPGKPKSKLGAANARRRVGNRDAAG